MNNEAIESLRTFALANNEVAFAHLCTAALGGEEWAVDRVSAVLTHAIVDPTSAINTTHALNLIRFTDTTRPDGVIARTITI